MSKSCFFRLNLIAIMSLCLVSFVTQAYAYPKQQRSYYVADATPPATTPKPAIPDNMMPAKNSDKDLSELSVVEILSNDPSFSTLKKALVSADLLQTLSGPGPFTIFAPNDQAFAKLSPNTLTDLLSPENKTKLKALLTYHVVPGKINAEELKTMKLKSLHGKILEVKQEGNKISVNNAKVGDGNKEGSNGVVYTIDAVLIP